LIKRVLLVLSLAMLCAVPCSAGAGPDFEEGAWEITMTVQIPGVPTQIPPITNVQCLKKDDPIPRGQQPGQECELQDMKVKGNSVTWVVSCTDIHGEMTGRGKATYGKDKMTGSMTMEGEDMTMIIDMKGNRIGKCR
jgi:hypothetical protein